MMDQPGQLQCSIMNVLDGVMYDKQIMSNHNLRYDCETHPGWSGAAVISKKTGKVIGVHSGGYQVVGPVPKPMKICENWPCDFSIQGKSLPLPLGRNTYGVSTLRILHCFDKNGNFDLSRPLCGKLTY